MAGPRSPVHRTCRRTCCLVPVGRRKWSRPTHRPARGLPLAGMAQEWPPETAVRRPPEAVVQRPLTPRPRHNRRRTPPRVSPVRRRQDKSWPGQWGWAVPERQPALASPVSFPPTSPHNRHNTRPHRADVNHTLDTQASLASFIPNLPTYQSTNLPACASTCGSRSAVSSCRAPKGFRRAPGVPLPPTPSGPIHFRPVPRGG